MRGALRGDPPRRHRRARAASGSTLTELLVIVALLGILALLALQAYIGFKAAAFDAKAVHDLGNAAVAQEAYYATSFRYVSFEATGPTYVDVPGIRVSDSVTLKGEASVDSFTVSAKSSAGTGKRYLYDSKTDTIRSD